MPEYLFTARTEAGKNVTNRVTAPTIEGARYALETRRYTEIVFHTDDASIRQDEQMRTELDPNAVGEAGDPEQQLAARRRGGAFREVWLAWLRSVHLWLPPVLWSGWHLVLGQPFGFGLWADFTVSGCSLLLFIYQVLPVVGYQAVLQASTWNRLKEARLWVGFLKRIKLVGGGSVPKLDLDVRLACVLARNDAVEEGRRLLAPYEAQAANDPMMLGRIAGFYSAANDHARALELRIRAVEVSHGGLLEIIDHAFCLARHLERPTEAQASLDRIADRELTEIARIFVDYTHALIALHQRRFEDALKAFDDTQRALAPLVENELMKGMLRDIWAFRALTLAGLGRVGEARTCYRQARPMLEARRETKLLERCRSAIPQAD